jgi:penicillin-binding protein 2
VSYWFRNDNRLPQERLAAASYVIVGMITLLLFGFWKLQVVDSDKYGQLAERNRVRSIPIIAPRGRMLDRDGRVLVDNYPSFSVILLRDDMVAMDKSLPAIADGLGLSLDDLKEQLGNTEKLPKFQPIVIKPEATPADVAFIESHRADIPLLEMLMVHRRRYLPGGFMSHATGYVGEVSEQQIESSNGKLRPGDFGGKTGLEREYNDLLVGTDGMRRVIVNSVGKEVGRLSEQEPIPGKQIQLTIDYDLQQVAEDALAGKKGAIVALDPRTGEVLAYVSRPAPDANDFAIRVSKEEWQRLNSDTDHPLMNRVIQAQLAPGSVFKIVMATAMLQEKVPPENFTAFCPGYAMFYGRMFKCDTFGKGGDGLVGLHRAILRSCDVFFYNVGMRMGIERISRYAKLLGLGSKTGIDLPAEESGLVPSEEWAQRVYHRKWYPGETISVSIGQGAVTATPIQLARMIGGVASGGDFKQPHLFKDAQNIDDHRVELAEDTVEQVTQGMYGVVNEGGTAGASRLEGIEFCGKTGTAQVIGEDAKTRYGKGDKKFKNNAWFVGYAPRRNPEIVVTVLVEGGGFGAESSAPIAKNIVKAYYDKKNKKEHGSTTVEFKQPYNFGSGTDKKEAEESKVAVKPEQAAALVPVAVVKK